LEEPETESVGDVWAPEEPADVAYAPIGSDITSSASQKIKGEASAAPPELSWYLIL
jgi:hypothetical protein